MCEEIKSESNRLSPSENSESKFHAKGKLVIVLLFITMVVHVSAMRIIAPTLSLFIKEFDIDEQFAGTLSGIYSFAAAIFALLSGPFSDKYGRKLMLSLGIAGLAIGNILTAVAINYPFLMLFRFITGAASGLLAVSIIAYVGDFFPYQRRGKAIGIVVSAFFAASIIGVPVGTYLAGYYKWNIPFLLYACLSIPLYFLVTGLLPDVKPGANHHKITFRTYLKQYGAFFRNPNSRSVILFRLCIAASMSSFMSYFAYWLLQTNDFLETKNMGMVFLIIGSCSFLGSLAVRHFTDKFPKRKQAIIGNLILAIGLIIIPLLVSNFWVVIATYSGVAFAGALRSVSFQTLLTESVPGAQRGAFLSMAGFSAQIGISIGSTLAGIIYINCGFFGNGTFAAAVTMIAVWLMLFLIKEPKTPSDGLPTSDPASRY